MHQILNKKIITCLLTLLVFLTCVSCKAVKPYLSADYLNMLVNKVGLGDGDNSEESLNNLISWGVIEKEKEIAEYLNYNFLAYTINRLIENEDESLKSLKDDGFVKKGVKEDDLVSEEIALGVIDKAVSLINNKTFSPKYEYSEKDEIEKDDEYVLSGDYLKCNARYKIGDLVYLENDGVYKKIKALYNDGYLVEDAYFEEVMEEFDIEDSFEIDFEDSFDISGEVYDEYSYANHDKNLLASKTKTFNSNGFRVSYNFKSSGISARISKNVDGYNLFFDIAISNIKPSYKWQYKDGKLNNAYFKVDYKSVEEVGVSIGRYKNYTLDFKDVDSSSFLNLANSIIKKKDDEVAAIVKICEIKTPIPSVPSLFFNIELLAKIYVSGKVEVVLSNTHNQGFEIKDGHFRLISDSTRDIDFKIGASAKASLGINFNLEAVSFRLMDIEVDAGIKASVSTIVHLYDKEGNKVSLDNDLVYSTVDELAKENKDVKVCGDISLNWLFEIRFNTSKTLLYKFGLWYKKEILDDNVQVFGNKTHIENFVLVDKCTRKERYKNSESVTQNYNVDKILLYKYSKVINLNEEYAIEIKNLPNGYTVNDLIYTSLDNNIVIVDKGVVKGLKIGSCEVKISTTDNLYSASINILVSSG